MLAMLPALPVPISDISEPASGSVLIAARRARARPTMPPVAGVSEIADRRAGGRSTSAARRRLARPRGPRRRRASRRLLARAVALPLAVRRVEDDVERRRPAGNADLELDLVPGAALADHPLVAGERDALRPDAIGRLGRGPRRGETRTPAAGYPAGSLHATAGGTVLPCGRMAGSETQRRCRARCRAGRRDGPRRSRRHGGAVRAPLRSMLLGSCDAHRARTAARPKTSYTTCSWRLGAARKISIRNAAGFVPGWPSVCGPELSTCRSQHGSPGTRGMRGSTCLSMTPRVRQPWRPCARPCGAGRARSRSAYACSSSHTSKVCRVPRLQNGWRSPSGP